MTNIKIKIECGQSTCASEPGKFCAFFGSVKFGLISVCRLFPTDENSFTVLEEQNGWVQRCADCKESQE